MTQNYKLLGLSSRLNAPTGGIEKKSNPSEHYENQPVPEDTFSIPKSRKTTKLVPTETRVERDPQTGRILRTVSSDGNSEDVVTQMKNLNPLNDPLLDLPDERKPCTRGARPGDVIAELEAQAEAEAAILVRKRRPRQQSKREEEWIARLAEKYGDDTRAMARDIKLNPMQQSKGDLARRLKNWKASRQTDD